MRGTPWYNTALPDPLRQPWLVVVILAAGLAAWMGLGTLHQFQHADSLLTVLVSTQRWTPFFWGQDRFGMLVPLVAIPIRHPLANLLAQGWMMTAAALLAPFVMARCLTGRAGPWLAIGACTNTLFLLVAAPAVQFDWLVAQPYGLSISLGFAALILAAEDRRLPAGIIALVLLALACWVNIGVGLMLAIAAVIVGARPVRLLTLAAAATALASLAARYGATAHTVASLAAPRQWLDGWRQLIEGLPGVTASPGAVIGIAVGTAVAIAWLWRTDALPPWRPAAAICAMALGTWLVVGMSLWVGMNRYVFRYMYPTLMIAGVGVSIIIAALFAKRTRALTAAALAACATVTLVRYGTPSLARVERDVDRRFGGKTAAVIHSGATVVGGDYWRVWPAVFHANLALARTHTHARVFGLAYRSEETDPLWQRAGQSILIAGSPDDPSVEAVAGEHGVAATLQAHLPEIDLYVGRLRE
jgi:hypothetical protein